MQVYALPIHVPVSRPQVRETGVESHGRRRVQVDVVEDVILNGEVGEAEEGVIWLRNGCDFGIEFPAGTDCGVEDEGVELEWDRDVRVGHGGRA